MEDIMINYWAILVLGVVSMALGALWYGPLFGKKWMEIIGVDDKDLEARKEMEKGVWKLYIVQFVLALFQILVLAHLIADTVRVSGVERALWVWAAFVVPTVAAGAMWNNDSSKVSWARFLIQGGYQLLLFVIYGLVLMYWK